MSRVPMAMPNTQPTRRCLAAEAVGMVIHDKAINADSESPEEMMSVAEPSFAIANPNRKGEKAWPNRAGAAIRPIRAP